jgi:Domain of Unknown Function (DUF1080)
MKTHLALLTCLASLILPLAAAEPLKHPDTTGPDWKPLFKPDLSDAQKPDGVWSVENGVLTAVKDEAIWTTGEYGAAVIDLEFKTDKGTNSGVIVYATDTQAWIPNSVEIQIADDHSEKWSKEPRTWQCAAIFGRLAAKKSVVKPPGEWNRMTVICKGKHIDVVLNGEHVTSLDMSLWTSAKQNPDGSPIPPWLSRPLAEMATKGRIGLQGKHADAAIWYRNVKVLAK